MIPIRAGRVPFQIGREGKGIHLAGHTRTGSGGSRVSCTRWSLATLEGRMRLVLVPCS